MAQRKCPSSYTFFQDQLLESLKLLRNAADIWAARGDASLDVSKVLAGFISIFASQGHRNGKLNEFLAQLDSLESEFRRLKPQSKEESRQAAAAEMEKSLTIAARNWSRGNPEDPLTAHVLSELTTILHCHHFVERPPPTDLDRW